MFLFFLSFLTGINGPTVRFSVASPLGGRRDRGPGEVALLRALRRGRCIVSSARSGLIGLCFDTFCIFLSFLCTFYKLIFVKLFDWHTMFCRRLFWKFALGVLILKDLSFKQKTLTPSFGRLELLITENCCRSQFLYGLYCHCSSCAFTWRKIEGVNGVNAIEPLLKHRPMTTKNTGIEFKKHFGIFGDNSVIFASTVSKAEWCLLIICFIDRLTNRQTGRQADSQADR